MANGKKVTEALKKVFAELNALPVEELKRQLDEQDEKMRQNVIHGRDDLGIALWYGQDPKACQEWIDKVLQDARDRKETT